MSGTLRLRGSTSGYSELQAPAVAADQTFVLPTAGGTLLTTDSPVPKLTLELGSASQPTLTFQGDTDTGLFSEGTNTLNLVTGGSTAITVDSSQRVGIGISSPQTKFHSSGTTNGAQATFGISDSGLKISTFQKTNNDAGVIFDAQQATNGTLTFRTAGSERLRINSSGNVGIQTTNPVRALQIGTHGSGNGEMALAASTTGNCSILMGDGATGSDFYRGYIQYQNNTDSLVFATAATQRLVIDSSGRLLLNTSSARTNYSNTSAYGPLLNLEGTSNSNRVLSFIHNDSSGGPFIVLGSTGGSSAGSNNLVAAQSTLGFLSWQGADGSGLVEAASIKTQVDGTPGADDMPGRLVFTTTADGASSSTERMRIDSSGRLGIGTSSPGALLDLGTATPILRFSDTNTTGYHQIQSSNANFIINADPSNATASSAISFNVDGSERARIDSSGRVLVGTSSTSLSNKFLLQGDTSGANNGGYMRLQTANSVLAGTSLGSIGFGDTGHNGALIEARGDVAWNPFGKGSRLEFSTTASGATSPAERMRITSGGALRFGQTTSDTPATGNITGATLAPDSYLSISRSSDLAIEVNRKTNDGSLMRFLQDGTPEGTISVSGTTVSYNGAHLSRWSQLPGGAQREEIQRGTVLSNIDEMCEWGEEENEQLNRMKVSEVEGDPNVSGVFQAWDDDDDTYTNDFYCAMTGDFIIRIAEGVTVQRGDLLMSAGDGTAKPQDDDIIRSKTVAKVTSTHVTCTYDDGSYCVPCVLMACQAQRYPLYLTIK